MKREKKRPFLRKKLIGINVAITLASLLLCGILFVSSVSILVSKYVNHDMDFFLTQMAENLDEKLSYLEEIIYKIRDADDIMEYLQGNVALSDESKIRERFEKVVNISSEKNIGPESEPVIDKVYLFPPQGKYFSSFYYAMTDTEIENSNQQICKVFERYQNNSGVGYCEVEGDSAYLAYPLYDDNMDNGGTLIYELNIPTLEVVMEEVSNYQNAFWLVYREEIKVAGNSTSGKEEYFSQIIDSQGNQPHTERFGTDAYQVYQKELCLNMMVSLGVPKNQVFQILYDSLALYILGIVAIVLLGVCSFVIVSIKMTKPFEELTDRLKQVQVGDFETKLPDYGEQEFHEISTVFNEMTAFIHNLIKQVYEKQITIKDMELKFLQTQMNPHFMFNVLNTIGLQAKMDGNEEVSRMIASFSKLIRAKIYRSDTEKVKIKAELEYVEYYLYLQNYRYGERLQYEVEIEEEELLEYLIPKLCMQLIVENAVVHGIEPKMGDGKVTVRLARQEVGISIIISDNGMGFGKDGDISLPIPERQEEGHNQVGLNNAHHIIQLMYGEGYGLHIYSQKNKGTVVTINIPYDKGMEE